MPYCNNCGAVLSESTNFCTVCGNKIIEQVNPEPTGQLRTETNIQKISNKHVWLAIFMPLIMSLAYSIFDYLIGSFFFATIPETATYAYSILTFISFWILLYIDYYNIKKKMPSYNVKFGWSSIPLVYLYKRAKALKQSMSYFIVECIITFLPVLIVIIILCVLFITV